MNKAPARRTLRLELNAAGSWRLIARFDGFTADDRVDVLTCAERLVDALHTAGSTTLKLRVSVDGDQPRALAYFETRRGWYPRSPRELMAGPDEAATVDAGGSDAR